MTLPRFAPRLATLAVACALAAPAAAAENIVLMPLELSSGLETHRADLEAAVVKGLAVSGRPVVAPADSANARGTYLVTGNVGKEGTTFTARFWLTRTSDRREISTQENHCDMVDCSVAELARRSARELVRQTLGRPSDEVALEPTPPRTPPPPDTGSSSGMGRLGVGAIAAGAVAIGVGIYLVAIDGRCSTSPPMGHMCKAHNVTLAGGIASIAGGVAAGALGVYLLVRDDGPEGTSVAIGVRPSGVVVAGRF